MRVKLAGCVSGSRPRRRQRGAPTSRSGLEVEDIDGGGRARTSSSAKCSSVARHPNADRCRSAWSTTARTAPDRLRRAERRAGMKAPFARVGAQAAERAAIRTAKLRGVESRHAVLGARARLATTRRPAGCRRRCARSHGARRYLALDDAILEVKLTPNRGDCFSVLGIAREVAARTRR